MKLFLTSSTITKELVESFEKLLGKQIKGLKAAFIPDAAYGISDTKDSSWVKEERQFLIDKYNWKITDVVLRDIDKLDESTFKDCDVIFVNGGFSGYLAKEMARTGFDKILPKLLKKGVVYVGSSAGSMVMSDTQDASSWYINEPEPDAINVPGLGYIDFQIYPHIKSNLIEKIKEKRNPNLKYCLLKDGQAITVNKDKVILHGKDIICLPPLKSISKKLLI